MAEITFTINTKSTGPLSLKFELSEQRAQEIFEALVHGGSPGEELKLGDCLREEAVQLIRNLEQRAISRKRRLAAEAAVDQIDGTLEANIVRT